ncbi:MAG TPA: hypothetical protein VFR58_07245 [Flavisolibacter sp.]|nr:hypothetical protein [Flavisolibacter sp.]
MYNTLLALHSLTRWLVLLSLLYAIFIAFRGWRGRLAFTAHHNLVRHLTATIAHVQLLLGLGLYFISPIIRYFLQNFKQAVAYRPIRFFGMEHSLMMFIAITVLTIGSAKAKRRTGDREKFRTMAIWYTIALLLILSSVPWPFSPMVQRPAWRGF